MTQYVKTNYVIIGKKQQFADVWLIDAGEDMTDIFNQITAM